MASEKLPSIIVEKSSYQRLTPISAYDAELIDAYPLGSMFVIKPIKKRSITLHRTYWLMLTLIVKATGRWATPEKLHAALMWSLGFITIETDMDGIPHPVRDSIAFHNMPHDAQFRPVFDAAVEQIALTTGTDPLLFLEKPK